MTLVAAPALLNLSFFHHQLAEAFTRNANYEADTAPLVTGVREKLPESFTIVDINLIIKRTAAGIAAKYDRHT